MKALFAGLLVILSVVCFGQTTVKVGDIPTTTTYNRTTDRAFVIQGSGAARLLPLTYLLDNATYSNATVFGSFTGNGGGLTNVITANTNDFMRYATACWGDSTTVGLMLEAPGMFTNNVYYDGGVGGENSTQIKTRLTNDVVHRGWPSVIWAGNNYSGTTNQTIADIQEMVAYLGHQDFLLLGGMINTSTPVGTTQYMTLTNMSFYLSQLYTNHWFDTMAYLKSQTNGTPEDGDDVAQGIVPRSLRLDSIHLNPTGYRLIAQQIEYYKATNWLARVQDLPFPHRALQNVANDPPHFGSLWVNGTVRAVGKFLDLSGRESLLYGTSAGAYSATNATNVFILGRNAGANATNAADTLMIGNGAGQYATSARLSEFVGLNAGQYAASAIGAIYHGASAGQYNSNGLYSTYFGDSAGKYAVGMDYGIVFGLSAAERATNSDFAVIAGYGAGQVAHTSSKSVLLGQSAGAYASISPRMIALGSDAGARATNSSDSIFIGSGAGSNVQRQTTLIIDSTATASGTNAFVYGEMDRKMLRINGNLEVSTNLTVAGTVTASNGVFTMTVWATNYVAPTWVTNGLFAIFNSNGTPFKVISAPGSTAQTISPL